MQKFIIILLILLMICLNIFSASVNVDELKIIADGQYHLDTGKFDLNTYFKFISSFDGGYKFAAKVAFEANVQELEKSFQDATTDLYNKVFMIFRSAEVTAQNLADSHLSLSFWTGTYKYLGSGNKYKGYLFYPNSINEDYCGFYRLRGTGISTTIKFWEDRFKADFHFYQNTNFINAENPDLFYIFSFDTTVGLYFYQIPFLNEYFSIFVEIFGGITFPRPPYQLYKAGLNFGIGNNYVDFFVSAGIPKLDDTISNFSFDYVYLAADLHFKILVTDHTVSFLTRPLWYNEQKYGIDSKGEKGDIDVNYKFNVIVPDFPLNGGFILNFKYSKNDADDPWNLFLVPFIDITFTGVIWNVSVYYDFSRIYIGNLNNQDSKIYLEGLKVIIGASSKF